MPSIYSKLLDVDKVDLIVSGYATPIIAAALPIAMQHDMVLMGLFGLANNAKLNYDKYFGAVSYTHLDVYKRQPLYCIVTDTSDGGVRVHANGFHVPDQFRLLITGDGPFQNGDYRVIWRLGQEVGAKLVGVA